MINKQISNNKLQNSNQVSYYRNPEFRLKMI